MEEDSKPQEYYKELNSNVLRFEEMMKKKDIYFFDVDAFESISDYYLDHKNAKQALLALDIAIKQHPTSTSLLLNKALAFSEIGRLTEALDLMNQIEPFYENDCDFFTEKAHIYSRLIQHENAITCFQKAIELSEDSKQELCFELAIAYTNCNQFDKAINLLINQLKQNPEDEEAISDLSCCFLMAEKMEESATFFKKFVEDYPYSFLGWFELSNSFSSIGMHEMAICACDYCLLIRPDLEYAFEFMGDEFFILENDTSAIKWYKNYLSKFENDIVVLCKISQCYRRLGNLNKAKEYAKKVVNIDESDAEGWYEMGKIKEAENNIIESIHCFAKAVELSPENTNYWIENAKANANADYFGDADDLFNVALDMEPQNTNILFEYADFLYNNYLIEDAIETLKDRLLLFPGKSDIKYRIAAFTFMSNKPKQGYIYLEDALQSEYKLNHTFLEFYPEGKLNHTIMDLIELYKN